MDKEETPLKQIRTFQGDVAEALRKQRESLVSIQRQEALRKGAVAPEHAGKRKQFVMLFLGSLLFLVLGTLGGWFAYNEFLRKTAAPNVGVPANRFIFAGDEVEVEVLEPMRETLITQMTDALSGTPDGEVRHVVLKKRDAEGLTARLLSSTELLGGLASRAPGYFLRALDPLFMFGAVGSDHFLIIKLTSFENAFAGMLAWEPSMAGDIGPLFETANLLRGLPPEPTFSDLTDRNKDIRVLSLEDQRILLYTFFDSETLVVTENLDTLHILLDRLAQEKLSR